MRERDLLSMGVASTPLLLPAVGAGDAPGAAERPAALPTFWPALATGLHRVAYLDWGGERAETGALADTVVCVHGFSRNAHDFDPLARHLSRRRRVVCPDLPGRGRSAWLDLDSADRGYNLWQYVVDVTTLIARLDVREIDWIGTSMGGLVGMLLAARPDSPVRRLVLNDVGPVVPATVLEQMAGYLTADPDLASVEEAEAYLRRIHPGFGAGPAEHWRHLAEHSVRRKPGGALGLAFDPAIGAALRPPFVDVDLRPFWLAVRCPVLVLRGETSTALPADLAEEMASTGPQARVVEVPGCGHAPMLATPEQIGLIETWLDTGEVGVTA